MTRWVVLVGFVVSFAAGLTIGLSLRASARAGDRPPPGSRGSWLAQQLQLTPQQREQMDAIWSEAAGRGGGREAWAQKRELREQRDRAIAELIPPDRRSEYDALLAQYEAATEALDAQWRQSFQEAVEKTRQILTPEQRQKYEQLMSRHGDDRKPPGPGPGHGPGHGPGKGPAHPHRSPSGVNSGKPPLPPPGRPSGDRKAPEPSDVPAEPGQDGQTPRD